MFNRRNFLKGFLATATVVALAPLAPVIEMPITKNVTFDAILNNTLNIYREVMAKNITRQSAIFLKLKEFGYTQ